MAVLAHNKLLKFTSAQKSADSAGQLTLYFGCPLPRSYTIQVDGPGNIYCRDKNE